ncbi:MAG: hypothetical protein HUJ65_00225, partial [Oscillospiraceae bacterium]|nr:hypothetical protein [Oscillospiraceae bacterium]
MVVPIICWVAFVTEMVLRFFPSRTESMGCQKQFRRNYIPKKNPSPPKSTFRST